MPRRFLAAAINRVTAESLVIYEEYQNETVTANRVFFCVAGDDRYIVKVGSSAQLPVYRKEDWCMKAAAEVGVPTPKSYLVDLVGRHAIFVQEHVSRAMEIRDMTDEALWRRVGELIRRTESVAVKGFGENFLAGGMAWTEYLYWWESKVLPIEALTSTELLGSRQLQSAFEAVSELRSWDPTPCLQHRDITPQNVLVDKADNVVLIDWGWAAGHVPAYNLLHLYCLGSMSQQQFAAIVAGYGLSVREWEEKTDQMRPLITMILLWKMSVSIDNGDVGQTRYYAGRLAELGKLS